MFLMIQCVALIKVSDLRPVTLQREEVLGSRELRAWNKHSQRPCDLREKVMLLRHTRIR